MAETTTSTASGPKDVLIFVPGIGETESLKVGHVAQLVCWELNQQAPDRATRFAITPISVDTHPVHRILRTDRDGTVTGVLDIYGYDSVAELDNSTSTRNPLLRALSLGLVAITGALVLFRVIFSVRRRAKTRPQLLQAFILLLITAFIFVYFGIAVFALIEAILTIAQGSSDGPVLRWPQWVVLIGAVVGGLVPSFRERITWLGERAVQMARFTLTGGSRNRLSGGIQTLVDTIAHRSEVDSVHLVGYSFGALVAMEAVYPQGGSPAPTLSLVKTLVTIGSPFDLVRMVRPSYSEGRTFTEGVDPKWVNIYQPIDVLGSNFRDDTESAAATTGLESPAPEQTPTTPSIVPEGFTLPRGYTLPKAYVAPALAGPATATRTPTCNLAWNPDLRLNAANFLILRSLSVHAQYWDDSTTARSAIGLVVSEVTTSRRILGTAPSMTAATELPPV